MARDTLRALPSFPGEAMKHNLIAMVQLVFAETQKSNGRVTGWREWYLETGMIMVITKGQFPEKRYA